MRDALIRRRPSLHWQDVHLDDPAPHIMVRYGKPGKPRKNGKVLRVPLFGMALEAFLKMPRKKSGIVFPAPRGGYRARARIVGLEEWKAWRKAAGLPAASASTTFATRARRCS